MDENSEFIKQVDIQKIATEGAKIYESIKANYDPKETGNFLAIDIDTKKVYLAGTSAEAVVKARAEYPDKVFYVVKVGFDTAETMAMAFLNPENK